jgi:hypothetical protein
MASWVAPRLVTDLELPDVSWTPTRISASSLCPSVNVPQSVT